MPNEANLQNRTKTGFYAGIFGILTNLTAFFIKIIVGLLSGSVTIAADAVNSLTDACSSVLTMVGFKLAAKPADEDHPFGHARYEQITALVISLIMLAVGVLFAKESFEKIISPIELSIGGLTYFALATAILLKIIQAAVNFKLSKKIGSDALRAAALDSRNDVLITSSVLVSVLIMGIFDVNVDGLAGFLVSLFIIYSSIEMVRDTVSPMLGSQPPEGLVRELTDIVMSRPEILGYHDLQIHNYGAGANFASIHAEIDERGTIVRIHEVIDGIEKEVLEKLGVNLTIHMDPIKIDRKDTNAEV